MVEMSLTTQKRLLMVGEVLLLALRVINESCIVTIVSENF